MKNKYFIGCIVIMMFLLVACSPKVMDVPPLEDLPINEKSIDDVPKEEPVEEKNMGGHDSELVKLIEKSKTTENYKYLLSISTKNAGGNFEETNYWISRIENKVRVGLTSNAFKDGDSYTDIFLDLDAKTAFGRCLYFGVSCEKRYDEKMELNYDEINGFIYIKDMLNDIPTTAKVIGTKYVENRDALSVEYEENGKVIEVAIDKYYGFPVRKVTFILDGTKRVTQQKIIVKRLEVNQLSAFELDVDLVEPKVRS